MSLFTRKTWKDRVSEHPMQRILTDTSGNATVYTVARNEGTVSAEGDAFSASNMNDLEDRFNTGITNVNMPIYTATFAAAGWVAVTPGYTQTKAVTGMTTTTQLSGPMTRPTGIQATDEALQDALNIINKGSAKPESAGSVTIHVWEKPTSDIDVYWYGKELGV